MHVGVFHVHTDVFERLSSHIKTSSSSETHPVSWPPPTVTPPIINLARLIFGQKVFLHLSCQTQVGGVVEEVLLLISYPKRNQS